MVILRPIDRENRARREHRPQSPWWFRALQLLGQFAAQPVGNVNFAPFERDQSRGLVRNCSENYALNAWALAPILIKSLKRQLYARDVCRKFVGASTHGRLFEPILAHLLYVLLGYYLRCTRGTRVEGHEVRPRLLKPEDHVQRVWGLDSRHAALQRLVCCAPIAFK